MSANDTAVAAVSEKAAETTEQGLLDQIVAQGRFTRDAATLERGRDMVKEFVSQVLEGHMTVTRDAEATIQARIAQIDRLISHQLNEDSALSGFPEAGGDLAGHQVPDRPVGNQRNAEDQGAQRLQARAAERFAEGGGIRPERVVQESVRRGVRRLRRSAVRFAGGRLRIRARAGGHRIAGAHLPGGFGGACAVPFGGQFGAC